VHLSEERYRIYGFDPAEGPPVWEKRLERVHPEDRLKWKSNRGILIDSYEKCPRIACGIGNSAQPYSGERLESLPDSVLAFSHPFNDRWQFFQLHR